MDKGSQADQSKSRVLNTPMRRRLSVLLACICLNFGKLAPLNVELAISSFVFAVCPLYPCKCRQLSLAYFDTEKKVKT